MKKRWLALALAGLLAFTGTGCTSEKAKTDEKSTGETKEIVTALEKPVEIEFWHAMSGSKGEKLQAITDTFNQQNPNIKVKLVDQGGYRDLFEKLMAASKANQLPTITQIYCNRLSWYIDKGLVEDLKPYMENEKIGMSSEDLADIPALFMEDGVWGQAQYAFPFNKSQMVLFYNQDMLDKAGIKVPTTWEEWRTANEKLTIDENGDGNPEVYGTVFANNLSTDIAPWVKQAGGVIIDDKTEKINFDTPETKEAVVFLAGMIKDNIARTAGEDKNANVPFAQGRAAMCVASTSSIPYIEKDMPGDVKWFAAPLPAYKTNDQLYYGTNVAVFNTVSPEQRYGAWEYIKFLTNAENTAEFAMATGYLPVRKSAIELENYKAYIEKNPVLGVGLQSFDIGFQGARMIGEINALDVLGEELDEVFFNGKSIDEALKSAQERAEKAVQEVRNN